MDIDCPKCKANSELDVDDLPSHACDNAEYECPKCEHVFDIGWFAEAEIR